MDTERSQKMAIRKKPAFFLFSSFDGWIVSWGRVMNEVSKKKISCRLPKKVPLTIWQNASRKNGTMKKQDVINTIARNLSFGKAYWSPYPFTIWCRLFLPAPYILWLAFFNHFSSVAWQKLWCQRNGRIIT